MFTTAIYKPGFITHLYFNTRLRKICFSSCFSAKHRAGFLLSTSLFPMQVLHVFISIVPIFLSLWTQYIPMSGRVQSKGPEVGAFPTQPSLCGVLIQLLALISTALACTYWLLKAPKALACCQSYSFWNIGFSLLIKIYPRALARDDMANVCLCLCECVGEGRAGRAQGRCCEKEL